MLTKKCCLCCFLFTCFLLCCLMFACECFCMHEIFLLFTMLLIFFASIYYTTNVYPYQPTYREFTCTHLFLLAIICKNLFESLLIFDHLRGSLFIYDHLWESVPLWEFFWILCFCENLFLFMIICENLFLLWESFWIFLIYDPLCETIFLSPYENKHTYESHHLKHLFYHQNMLMVFCQFRMFQVYVFCFEFFSFCVSLFFCWTKCL